MTIGQLMEEPAGSAATTLRGQEQLPDRCRGMISVMAWLDHAGSFARAAEQSGLEVVVGRLGAEPDPE